MILQQLFLLSNTVTGGIPIYSCVRYPAIKGRIRTKIKISLHPITQPSFTSFPIVLAEQLGVMNMAKNYYKDNNKLWFKAMLIIVFIFAWVVFNNFQACLVLQTRLRCWTMQIRKRDKGTTALALYRTETLVQQTRDWYPLQAQNSWTTNPLTATLNIRIILLHFVLHTVHTSVHCTLNLQCRTQFKYLNIYLHKQVLWSDISIKCTRHGS